MHRTQFRNRLVRPAPTRTIHQIITASSTSAANQITSLTSLPIAAYRLTVNSLSQAGAKDAGRAAGWHRLMSGDDTIAAREAWGETLPAWSDNRR
jgi:hypothetical protein